jgi:hypothetical protein
MKLYKVTSLLTPFYARETWIQVEFLCAVTPSNVVVGQQNFRCPCCLYFQGEVKVQASQIGRNQIFTAMKTSNLSSWNLNFYKNESEQVVRLGYEISSPIISFDDIISIKSRCNDLDSEIEFSIPPRHRPTKCWARKSDCLLNKEGNKELICL